MGKKRREKVNREREKKNCCWNWVSHVVGRRRQPNKVTPTDRVIDKYGNLLDEEIPGPSGIVTFDSLTDGSDTSSDTWSEQSLPVYDEDSLTSTTAGVRCIRRVSGESDERNQERVDILDRHNKHRCTTCDKEIRGSSRIVKPRDIHIDALLSRESRGSSTHGSRGSDTCTWSEMSIHVSGEESSTTPPTADDRFARCQSGARSQGHLDRLANTLAGHRVELTHGGGDVTSRPEAHAVDSPRTVDLVAQVSQELFHQPVRSSHMCLCENPNFTERQGSRRARRQSPSSSEPTSNDSDTFIDKIGSEAILVNVISGHPSTKKLKIGCETCTPELYQPLRNGSHYRFHYLKMFRQVRDTLSDGLLNGQLAGDRRSWKKHIQKVDKESKEAMEDAGDDHSRTICSRVARIFRAVFCCKRC